MKDPTRDQILRPSLAFMAVLAIVLSGCAPAATAPTTEPIKTVAPTSVPEATTAPTATPAPQPEGALVFAGPGGDLGVMFQDILNQFSDKYAVEVTYVEGRVGDNFSKVQAQTQAGRPEIDVILTNDAVDPVGKAQGLFAPLDPALVPNLNELVDFAVPEDHIGALFMFTLVGLTYNTDTFRANGWDPPTSWEDIWSSKYGKCIVVAHLSGGNGLKSIVVLNYVASGGDYSDIDASIAHFEASKDNVVAVAGSTSEISDLLASGVGCLSVGNQGRTFQAQAAGAPVDFVIPKEGPSFIANPLELVANAPHPIAGQLAINYLLSAESQAKVLAGFFSPTNLSVPPATEGAAARVSVAAQLADLSVHSPPEEVFADLEEWIRKFDAVFAK